MTLPTIDPATLSQIMSLLMQVLVLVLGALVPVGIGKLLGVATGRHQDAQRTAYVATLVKAAQQHIGAHDVRYEWCAQAIHARWPSLPTQDVQALIEAGVADLKMGLGTFNPAVPADAVAAAPPAPIIDPLDLIKSGLEALAAQRAQAARPVDGQMP